MRLAAAILALLAVLATAATARAQGCGNETAGDCLSAHAFPGCADATCCNRVCQFNPACCQVAWDAGCVDVANIECIGLCGAAINGDCRSEHATPGCNDRNCCAAVCAIDPGCCDITWDLSCVLQANNVCDAPPPVPCGSSSAGACNAAHATPSCSDAACCNTVCAIDPSCCIQSWDAICVQLAAAYCVSCAINCPSESITEAEGCGNRQNDPCAGGVQSPASLTPGTVVCGQIDGVWDDTAWTGDRDVWTITVPDPNQDGISKVTIAFSAEFTGYAALVAPGCTTPLSSAAIHVAAQGCTESTAFACLPPGTYWVIVAPGTFPNVGLTSTIDCGTTPRYTLRVSASDVGCTPACTPTAGPCFEPHVLPGCADATCCAVTCAADPFCCTDTWDGACAARAAQVCNAPIPANDECGGAIPLRIGQTITFNTAVARVSQPALPTSCDQGSGVTIGNDLWYVHDAERSGNVVVATCGSATNLRVAVYTGQCGGLTLVGCNSNSIICIPAGGARLQFVAACGTRYWIRVGGESPDHAGLGSVTLSGQGPVCVQPCAADLDGNRLVNGADLGVLLGNWGNAGAGDLDGNGVVNGADLGALLGAFGPCP
jgi:hypothetical protein